MDHLGVYISVPFCKAKCTFCNFASDAFAPSRMEGYTARVCKEIAAARARADDLGAVLPERIDTLYFGGGTPSLLEPDHVRAIFETLRDRFEIASGAEITLECAPGQLSEETLAELLRQGLNRVSLGVQSFVDQEAAAVGRLHTRAVCLAEIDRLRAAGIANLNLDLIAGLPLQTEASWRASVEQAIATGVPHLSVYMLEVDEDSRLGREALAREAHAPAPRYHAAQLPTDEQTADFYQLACELFAAAGTAQYEISNFGRPGFASRHNLKYWRRDPYLGLGLDAHSMLSAGQGSAVRFANTDDLDAYLAGPANPFAPSLKPDRISPEAAFEEALFLGLRLNEGVSLAGLRRDHGSFFLDETLPALEDLRDAGLLTLTPHRIALTAHGRLLSNEVFSRILQPTPA
jgi:oxygen-independent coproporphyrinogen-3 oxidase